MTIDIKAQLHFLRDLQEIDVQVRTIDAELEELPQQIAEARQELTALEEELAAKTAEKEAAEKEKRNNDAELADTTERLKERETKLFSIKTNKEYQAALKEIADGKRDNKSREDKILASMEKIDTISKEITQLSQTCADKESEFKIREEEFAKRKAELEQERNGKIGGLKLAEENVDKDILAKYNFIKSRYMDPLARVTRGICEGCNMHISPQTFIDLQKYAKIHFCPHCHRLIYFEEEVKDET